MPTHLEKMLPQLEKVFARYRPLVGDWDVFLEALSRPLPVCLWANPYRITREALQERLQAFGWQPEALPWHPLALTLPAGTKAGGTWPYQAGLFHIQEQVSMIPPSVLAPQPGERVLDLCAAPGGKTAQLSVQMENTGTLIANDRSGGRLTALRRLISRLGLLNIVMTKSDGTKYPNSADLFDRILVDAPCSGAGTTRKSANFSHYWGDVAYAKRLSGVQTHLLSRAVNLCKPGGTIVYSTCTYAPEENEAVINNVLAQHGPKQLELMPIEIPGLVTSPGLQQWEGEQFSTSLQKSIRVWPHLMDTGGFFVACLRKSSSSSKSTSYKVPTPPPLPEGDCEDELKSWFGIDDQVFSTLKWVKQGTRNIYLCARSCQAPAGPEIENIGLLAVRRGNLHLKLTTAGAMVLGPHASQNVLKLPQTHRLDYIARTPFVIQQEWMVRCEGRGPVIVICDDIPLGVGIVRVVGEHSPEEIRALFAMGTRYLESQFPKAWAEETLQTES